MSNLKCTVPAECEGSTRPWSAFACFISFTRGSYIISTLRHSPSLLWVSDKLPMRRPPDSIHRLRSASRSPVLCWSPLLFWIPVIGVLWCFYPPMAYGCLWMFMKGVQRRKFRSQTSDNTDRWKSRGGKSQRRERKKNKDQRRERVRRKKMQVREKLEKSQNTVFFSNVLWLRRVKKVLIAVAVPAGFDGNMLVGQCHLSSLDRLSYDLSEPIGGVPISRCLGWCYTHKYMCVYIYIYLHIRGYIGI